MKLTSFAQWLEWNGSYPLLPYVEAHGQAARPLPTWEPAWKRAFPYSALLESARGGRYTYLCLQPEEVLIGHGETAEIRRFDGEGRIRETRRPGPLHPLQAVEKWLGTRRIPELEQAPRFLGGCIGFFSYDIARFIERLPQLAADDLHMPVYFFMRVHRLYIIDHAEQRLYVSVLVPAGPGPLPKAELRERYRQAEATARQMLGDWQRWADEAERMAAAFAPVGTAGGGDADLPDIRLDFPRGEFEEAVRKIQEYIRAGDVFQVNLSLRQSKTMRAPSARIYEWLRRLNPSPYMGCIFAPDFEIVSGSPELLVSVDGRIIRTRPIAGTRRRGRNDAEERAFIRELRENEKERAEHIMLVDLLRNDIGRVAEYGSVRVPELMTIESYSHVMHLVSEVRGKLDRGKTVFDCLAAVFPGGTITGAPKVRTMEIIEELEPVRRGIYTGSIGWIDYTGDMEFNITIRTLVVKNGTGYVQAGAGIVIDSVPEREFKESLSKAKALWKAVEFAETEWRP